MMHHLLFTVDRVRCALPLASVRIVIQMVEPDPVAESRTGIAGTINFHGQIIPILSVRSFFGIPDRAPGLADMLIITEPCAGNVALWVDETRVIQQSPVLPAVVENAQINRAVAPGVDVTAEGVFLFSDLSRFLEPGNFRRLDPAEGISLPDKKEMD